MNILKIKNQKSGGTLALFEKDSYLSVSQSVSQSVSESVKRQNKYGAYPQNLILKRRGSPLKIRIFKFFVVNIIIIIYKRYSIQIFLNVELS
jgi:hypothetical protein